MSANSPSKVLFGFHAINVRLKTAPKSVIEIYHDATRRDARMRQLAERVLAYIEAASQLGAAILIGDPQRNYFPRGRFSAIAEYQVPVSRELEDSETKKTAVWRL